MRDNLEVLKQGYMTILPVCDRDGRHILYIDRELEQSPKTDKVSFGPMDMCMYVCSLDFTSAFVAIEASSAVVSSTYFDAQLKAAQKRVRNFSKWKRCGNKRLGPKMECTR